jgi:ABC-type nitrate/sulfonate/bicarbonate transport system substrate-binding protein
MVDCMNKLEEAQKAFLKVRDHLLKNQEDFALAKAYKKTWRWYREHTTQEAIEILRKEANA